MYIEIYRSLPTIIVKIKNSKNKSLTTKSFANDTKILGNSHH